SEAKGIVYGFREMQRIGYSLEDISLAYRGRQGVDLLFSQNNSFAILEAKAGTGLSSLETYGGLRQGSLEYNISRLDRYLQYGNGANNEFAQRLLNEAYSGNLGSYASFYRGDSLYELPQLWPKIPAIKR